MPDPCSCSPGACHGGHTIDVGPSWVRVPEDRLRAIRDNRTANADETAAMAAELLAARARAVSMQAALDANTADREGLINRVTALEAELDASRADAGRAHGQAGACHARAMELRSQVTARDKRITELEGWQAHALQQARRAADDTNRWNAMWDAGDGKSTDLADMIDAILDQRDTARALVDHVQAALAEHPRCDAHPDDDVITCGWKRAVASVQHALETAA
ncbi:hypothetical protein ACFO5K_04475 [Nocardia halotolerans]|uniref:Uncharacterized protein n=1 Tax=Nocardia halotolerans TaxID=1755878 RepID=A0ABV8VBS7_9NOCA